MKFKDLIAMALRNLNARRLRTFLTVLGVIIGATSIIIMLSIGVGFKKINNDFFASLGDLTVLDVRSDMIWSEEMEENARKDNKKLCKVIKLKIAEIKKQKTFYLLPKFFKKY